MAKSTKGFDMIMASKGKGKPCPKCGKMGCDGSCDAKSKAKAKAKK